MTFQVAQILFGIVVLWKISDYASRRAGVWLGYSVAVLSIGLGIYAWTGPSSGISSLFFLIFIFGGLAALVAAERVQKQGMSGALKPPKPAPVVAAPPPPLPAPVPQTIIHYMDNRDQSIRIDNSLRIIAGAMTPEAARALFGLPMHFTQQRLENAYEEKIRLLDSQAQALPRGDQQSRLLISQKEDQLEQAYVILRG